MADSAIVDNRNGLNPKNTVTLAYQYTNSVTSTHSTTTAIQMGFQFSFGVSELVSVGTAQFSIGFTFSSTDTEATTSSQAQSFSQTADVTVPKGKVYKVVLTAEAQDITVPYTVPIQVTGTTETWFENQVNGHYNWSADAGTAFGWIGQYRCAGEDSSMYGDAGNGVGAVTITGAVSASQTANFKGAVYDITAEYEQEESSTVVQATPTATAVSGTLVEDLAI